MSEREESRNAARDAVIRQIERAFDGVSRTGDISVHQAMVVSDYGTAEEFAQATRRDTEARWQDVPDADIEACYPVFCYFLPVSFRYYLPAYMIWTLKNHLISASSTCGFTIYALNVGDFRPEDDIECFKTFSRPQSEAVCAFLRLMVEAGENSPDLREARKALDQYWSQFCPPNP